MPAGPMARFELTQIWALAILDMQLRRLASLERQKILKNMKRYSRPSLILRICLTMRKIMVLVKDELRELKAKSGNPRQTDQHP